jgi:hypothetical protein
MIRPDRLLVGWQENCIRKPKPDKGDWVSLLKVRGGGGGHGLLGADDARRDYVSWATIPSS